MEFYVRKINCLKLSAEKLLEAEFLFSSKFQPDFSKFSPGLDFLLLLSIEKNVKENKFPLTKIPFFVF
jgi:hypothetical protein